MTLYTFSIILFGIIPPTLLLLLARLETKEHLVSPLRVVAWVLIIGYSLKSLYVAYAIQSGLPFRTDYFTKDDITIGQLMVLLGTVSFTVGFGIAGRRRLKIRPHPKRKIGKLGSWLYWPVLLCAFTSMAYYFYLKGFHHQLTNLQLTSVQYFFDESTGTRSSLGFLLLGSDIIVVYFFYYLNSGQRLLRPNVYLPLIIFISLNYFLSSQRTGVLMIIIGGLLVSKVSIFNLLSKKTIASLVTVTSIMALLSLSSFIRGERDSVAIADLSVSTGIETTLTHGFEGAYAIDPAKLTAIALRTNEYLLGESFLMFFAAPIPRILWQEKPPVRVGPYVAQEILDFNNNSGAPPSAIGEFYINFGWVGVALGMLALGYIASVVRNHYEHTTTPSSHVSYVLFIIVLINFIIGDFSYAALTAIKYSIASWLCYSYYMRKKAG